MVQDGKSNVAFQDLGFFASFVQREKTLAPVFEDREE
jgi:hypothetical protein